MKCEFCGGEISLEQRYCPFCGKENEQAKEHLQDMAHFKTRYAATEKEVTKKTRAYAMVTVRAVLAVVLLIGIVILNVVAENAYTIPQNSRRKEALKNSTYYIEQLESCLENGDYLKFYSIMDYHNIPIYGDGPYHKYRGIYNASYTYYEVVVDTEKLLLHGKEENWRNYEMSSQISRLVRVIDDFYEALETRHRWEEDDPYYPYALDMQEKVEVLLERCFGISPEEIEDFLALSDTRKSLVIEEALLGEEEETNE